MESNSNDNKTKGLLESHHHHLQQQRRSISSLFESECCNSEADVKDFEMVKVSVDGSGLEVVNLDKEMWDQFQNSGFWRSPSMRHL